MRCKVTNVLFFKENDLLEVKNASLERHCKDVSAQLGIPVGASKFENLFK